MTNNQKQILLKYFQLKIVPFYSIFRLFYHILEKKIENKENCPLCRTSWKKFLMYKDKNV